jgi:hypothetical protein
LRRSAEPIPNRNAAGPIPCAKARRLSTVCAQRDRTWPDPGTQD